METGGHINATSWIVVRRLLSKLFPGGGDLLPGWWRWRGGVCRHLKRSRDSWEVGRKVACDASLGSSVPDTSWMGSWFSSLKRLMRAGEPSEYLIDTYKKFHRLCLHEVLLKVHIKPQGPLGTLNPGK